MARLQYVGIRYDPESYKVGEVIQHTSSDWLDGVVTGNNLNGLCTIGIGYTYDEQEIELSNEYARISSNIFKEIAEKYRYPYAHAYLVSSFYKKDGEDDDEWILEEPKVLRKLY